MRLNPYSILLIIVFNATVWISDKTIKNIKYEETINDSSF